MTRDWSIVGGDAGLLLLQGLLVTLKLSAVVLVLALALGLVFGVLRFIGVRAIAPLCWMYVELARNTPPVVQILFWYFSASYVLPRQMFLSLRDLDYAFAAAALALGIYHGAFIAEVVRAVLSAVPSGQFDGARALGLGMLQSLRCIVLPQALRIGLPPLVNEAVAIIKNTSLAMAIGVTELTYQYKHIDVFAFRGTEALVAVTVIYFFLCAATAGFGKLLSARLSRHLSPRRAIGTVPTSE
jgi:polar amino acid transport system permease protein